jgi:hypothetical protein
MAEPWIRVHANICGKPVIYRAVEALGLSPHEAIGVLVQFWGAVSQHATNGAVGGFSDVQLEAWAGWRGRKGRFAAFVRAAHLDEHGCVNEWDEYAGKLEDRKEKDRTRKRKSRGRHADSPQDVTLVSAPTIRDDTKRDESDVVVGGPHVPDEPELTGLFLTICANRAITERWKEQTDPLTPAMGLALASELRAEGVPPEFARLSIYRQCRESKLDEPPRHVNYFGPGVRKHWKQEQARRALAASGERPPSPEETRRQPSGGGERPSIGKRAFDTTLAAIEDIA